MELIFATHNNNKVKEVTKMLPSYLSMKSLTDINFFDELEEENIHLYNCLVSDFTNDRIQKENLTKYFNALFEEDIKSKTLNGKLKAIEPILFGDDNIIKSNGNRYFKI